MVPQPIIAVDTECTGANYWQGARPFAFSFCTEEGKTAFVRFKVDLFSRKVIPTSEGFTDIDKLLRDPTTDKVFHNAKFDIRMLEGMGFVIRGGIHDTVYAVHCCDSKQPNYKLKRLAKTLADFPDDDEKEVKKSVIEQRKVGKKKGWLLGEKVEEDYHLADPKILESYARKDAERTMLLWLFFRKEMKRLRTWDSYQREMKLHPITYSMEKRGVRFLRKECIQEVASWEKKVEDGEAEIEREAPGVNINSGQQLVKYFLSQGATFQRLTKKGRPSVDAKSIDLLAAQGIKLAKRIKEVRSSERALSTFKQYISLAVKNKTTNDWEIHCDYQQIGPVTGRFSCRKPNMQNVSDPLGSQGDVIFEGRKVFGPRNGYWWLHFDYSQLETVLFAEISGEKFIQNALKSGRDLHSETANRVWGGKDNPLGIEKIMSLGHSRKYSIELMRSHDWDIVKAEASIGHKGSRKHAKMLLFLKIFGGHIPAAMELLGVTEEEAGGIIGDYDRAFPGVNKFIRETARLARADRFVWDLYGRRISVDPDYAYQATNYKVQGTAASLIKDRMIAVDDYLTELRNRGYKMEFGKDNWEVQSIDAHLLLTIHDELVIEIRKDQVYAGILRRIADIMIDHGGRLKTMDLKVKCEVSTQKWSQKSKLVRYEQIFG